VESGASAPPLASVYPAVSASVAAAVASAVTAAFFGVMRAPPRPAPPREGVPVPRLVAVPRAGDGREGETTLATERTLPADAAVGLLSLERSTLRGTLGGGGAGAALRALARDAAVGANRPDVGMEGRGTGGTDGTPAAAAVTASARALAFFDDGVFGRGVVLADVVGVLAVVIVRESVDGALRVPVPFDGVERGVGVLEPVARAVAGDGRALGADDVDFEGEAGVLACLSGSVDGRDVGADVRGLIDGAAAGAGAGAGAGAEARAEVSCVVMGPSPSTVDETEAEGPVGAADGSGGHARSSGVSSSDVRDACVDVVPRNIAVDVEAVPFVLPFVLTGGHSRAVRCSSFTASPVLLEVALAAREDGPDDEG